MVSFSFAVAFKNTLLVIFILLSGCQSIDVRGQFVSDNAIEEINSRKLTQDEIIDLIGTPTYIPEYSHNTWYYIQRSLAKRAWFEPKVVEQRIVKISLNDNRKLLGASLLQDIHNENVNIERRRSNRSIEVQRQRGVEPQRQRERERETQREAEKQ